MDVIGAMPSLLCVVRKVIFELFILQARQYSGLGVLCETELYSHCHSRGIGQETVDTLDWLPVYHRTTHKTPRKLFQALAFGLQNVNTFKVIVKSQHMNYAQCLQAMYSDTGVHRSCTMNDSTCLSLSFSPYHFVSLGLPVFLMNGKKYLKSNMSEQLPLAKENPNVFSHH